MLRSATMSTKWFATRTFVVLLPLLAAAQLQQPQKWSGRVQSIVDGDGQAVTMVKSYVNRELRALGDVVVTDNADESEYLLSIIVVPVSGEYAISVLTAEHLSAVAVKTLLEQGYTKPDTIDLMNGFLKPMYHNTGHWI